MTDEFSELDNFTNLASWIYYDLIHDAFLCERCEKFMEVNYPIQISLLKQLSLTFHTMHLQCKDYPYENKNPIRLS